MYFSRSRLRIRTTLELLEVTDHTTCWRPCRRSNTPSHRLSFGTSAVEGEVYRTNEMNLEHRLRANMSGMEAPPTGLYNLHIPLDSPTLECGGEIPRFV
jgi:hypothetical protein